MRKIFIYIVGILCINYVNCMSEAQLRSAVKLIRNVCQPKFKVTNAQIDNMHKGIFEDDTKLQCYMSCGMHTLKFMKNGKMDYQFAISQMKTLPEGWKEPVERALNSCKDVELSSEKCEAAYQLAQCMYNAEPEYYVLP